MFCQVRGLLTTTTTLLYYSTATTTTTAHPALAATCQGSLCSQYKEGDILPQVTLSFPKINADDM